ncbi:hypothetical protein SAMN05421819_2867 [Bryocella elongata]|uniref:HicB family protein n=2 Tax=Bryocella elongata TaxID=863522 RepID=A0A1H6A3F1_9BACT|nr:hypothetical protein SAMN05421819_2867 [Bryocella elongata]
MEQNCVRHQSLPVHLGPSMQRQAAEIAQRAGVSLNFFISQAIEEKLSRVDAAGEAVFRDVQPGFLDVPWASRLKG